MKNTKTALVAAVAVSAAIALSACTPSIPTPTHSPTASSTPTPTPTVASAPMQQPVAPPKSNNDALVAATKTVEGYTVALFQVQADPSLGAEFMRGYVIPGSPMDQVMKDTVAANKKNGWYVMGAPLSWTTNYAKSYSAPSVTFPSKKTTQHGSVQLFGCIDNTKTNFAAKAGHTPAPVPKGTFPQVITVIYDNNTHVWMIRSDTDLTGTKGAPLC